MTDLRMAVNRQWNNDQGTRQEETTFLDVTLWSRQAELAAQYLSKGRPVYIEGRLQMESWEDKTSGQKRSRLKIVGENMQFLGSAGGGGGGGGERPQQQSAPQEQSRPQGGSPAAPAADAPAADDDDIPF